MSIHLTRRLSYLRNLSVLEVFSEQMYRESLARVTIRVVEEEKEEKWKKMEKSEIMNNNDNYKNNF